MNVTKAKCLALHLMKKHGLTNWTLVMSRHTKLFGLCSDDTQTIHLSSKLSELNTEAQVKDIILHEIAHALVGCCHDHNEVWKAKCREIGANPIKLLEIKNINTGLLESVKINGRKIKRGDNLILYGKQGTMHVKFWGYKTSNRKYKVIAETAEGKMINCPEACVVFEGSEVKANTKHNIVIPKYRIGKYLCEWHTPGKRAIVGRQFNKKFQIMKLIHEDDDTWSLYNIKTNEAYMKNIKQTELEIAIDINIGEAEKLTYFPINGFGG